MAGSDTGLSLPQKIPASLSTVSAAYVQSLLNKPLPSRARRARFAHATAPT